MNLAALSPGSQEALRRAMQYWVEHWDFECPTLFGIEVTELIEVLESWPSVAPGSESKAALAVLGALRELLYGASAPSRSEVPAVIGLSYEQAHALCSQLHAIVQPVLPT
jgi:hypothetical protein